MRVLVTWGSKAGGTEGIARIVGKTLRAQGHDVTLLPADAVSDPGGFHAVIVGGALYAGRWHRDARRLVARHVAALRRLPVWFFSSGPLDATADGLDIPPVETLAVLMDRVGARGHVTFGGRLAPDARGFPASAMAKHHSGDWRNPERIQGWATAIARELPTATPGRATEPPGRSPWRLLVHGLVGAAACSGGLAALLGLSGRASAPTWYALLVPLVFVPIALHYFRGRGARAALPTSLVFAGLTLLGQLAALAAQGTGLAPFRDSAALWVSVGLVLLASWATGVVLGFLPGVRPSRSSSSVA
jgi:menaquinone-dependent protoporphyrinogen oxidase